MSPSKLTPRNKVFIAEYLKDLNGTQAAIRAGYSKKTANEQAARLLANVSIRQAVNEAMEKRQKRTEVTQDYVLTGIKNLTERCIQNGKDKKPIEPNAAFRGYELMGRHLKMFTDKSEIKLDNLKDLSDEQLTALANKLTGFSGNTSTSGS